MMDLIVNRLFSKGINILLLESQKQEVQTTVVSTVQAVPAFQITTERLDDVPLLVAQMQHMGLAELLDNCFPVHGNWQGLSFGWVTTIWCSHIISEANHRLNHVQPWAQKRLTLLNECAGQSIVELDFSDDRLSSVLYQFSCDEKWYEFEGELSRNLIRVYSFEKGAVRLDSTSSSGYWQVTEEGLFQFGHSKDYRPDLPQLKVMLSVLEPMGLPLVTTVVPGNQADDVLYVPALERVREVLDCRGLLYIGDSKMDAIATRAAVVEGSDFYLCPLSKKQVSTEQLQTYLKPMLSGKQELVELYATDVEGNELKDEEGQPIVVGKGYEIEVELSAELEDKKVSWTERRLVVYSQAVAHKHKQRLRKRIDDGVARLLSLNERKQGKKHYQEVGELREAAEDVIAEYGLTDVVRVEYKQSQAERYVRGYGGRPDRTEIDKTAHLKVRVNKAAVRKKEKHLGWRVLGTNAPKEELPLSKAVLAYQANDSIEVSNFRRLKNKPLSLRPMYLQRDDHAIGLVRLLAICLRVMGLLEFQVREGLKASEEGLSGVYAGNPTRETRRPSTELLLQNFKDITMTIIEGKNGFRQVHITPLTTPQQRILELLGWSKKTAYEVFSAGTSRSPPETRQ